MNGARPFVEWDLGEPVHLVAAAVQADNNDAYRLLGSLDGKVYEPLWSIDTVQSPGLRERSTRELDKTVRLVRFEALSGDHVLAASEVRVFCEVPTPWPPSSVVRSQPVNDPVGTHLWQVQSFKIVFGLLAFPILFYLFPTWSVRARRRVAAAFIVLAALCWVQFGYFHGTSSIHYWDSFHYFMGTKYFPEAGYFELYRCGAAAERELGYGAELDKTSFRDLTDNRLFPGDWTRTPAGRCRAHFSPERWSAFKADLEAFRPLFFGHTLPEAFADHGFNATPLNTAWLRLFTHSLTASRTHVIVLNQLDNVALAATLAALFWGFGMVPGLVMALVLGIGAPWDYHWVGGSIGRATWLFCLALGFALLRRGFPLSAGAAMVVAGLLRLFPFVFVGGVGIWLFVGVISKKRLETDAKRFLLGGALALSLGVVTAGVAVGFGSYKDFSYVFVRHSSTPLSNHVGLSTLLGWSAGESSDSLADAHLTNPFEKWEAAEMRHRVERRPIWLTAIAISLAVIAMAAWRGAPAVVCASLAGLLVFAALPMTSYDYTWLIALIALAERRWRVGAAVLAFAVFTQVLFVFGGDTMEAQHLWISVACGVLLVYVAPWKELFPVPEAPP
jgi:hypothetical protein